MTANWNFTRSHKLLGICLGVFSLALVAAGTPPGQYRLFLAADQLSGDNPAVDWSGIVDAQYDLGSPPTAEVENGWKYQGTPREYPSGVTIDLGRKTALACLWIYDTNGKDDLLINVGEPGNWSQVEVYDCGKYKTWSKVELGVESRYLHLIVTGAGANFAQIAIDAYSERGYQALLDARHKQQRLAAEREELMRKAREEAMKRPLIEMPPYGTLSLVDEIDCAGNGAAHLFSQEPANASRIENILGRPARVLNKMDKGISVINYRLGKNKLLRPGAAYVLAVDYPEDAPRSFIIANTGNETIRGFHTGLALGDAFHPKYVRNHCESLNLPLSGKWETWTLLTQLHDRFPEKGGIRGAKLRPLTAEDGFTVSIAQFSAPNIPASEGAAVSRIRLFEVVNPEQLKMNVKLPAEDLPRRRISWREEMSDGVIQGKKSEERGLEDPLDWYRQKAALMHFLGINTYTKDLLEFGACQHWDSSPYGGNKWVYHDANLKYLWEEIVKLMGAEGFDIMPYYEYAGSKGQQGLGPRKLAKPLTRDDAYTHVKWIESSVADVTDPETYEDFGKMLDLTVLKLQDKANFAGIWIRPRRQMPVGFGQKTLDRFAAEANNGVKITREQVRADNELYKRYMSWWHLKRRDFLTGMRQHLIDGGLQNPLVMFTNHSAESGVDFPDWEKRFITDAPDFWRKVLTRPEHALENNASWQILSPKQVAESGLYLQALLAPALNWGDWEWHHSEPANDPQNYKETEGILLTHAFNRLYTVLSPQSMEAFSSPAGLALVRHYTLNENMAFDNNDKPRLGYFVADIERAGRFSMQSEVVAMATGNPSYIGYLSGSNFGRGFPEPVREFNANFLALPALPSKIINAENDSEIVLRLIKTDKHGDYLAIVHTGTEAKPKTKIKLPPGKWREIVSGKEIESKEGVAEFDLKPVQLLSLHTDK